MLIDSLIGWMTRLKGTYEVLLPPSFKLLLIGEDLFSICNALKRFFLTTSDDRDFIGQSFLKGSLGNV